VTPRTRTAHRPKAPDESPGDVIAAYADGTIIPKLTPTKVVEGRRPRVHYASPGPDRWKERSRTLAGIAKAMAEQWGGGHVESSEVLAQSEMGADCALRPEG
jgi:hypothetical protein